MQGLLLIIFWLAAALFFVYVMRFLALGIRYFERELGRDEDHKKSS